MVLTADPLPLVADAQGVVRIARTRVTLDTVVAAFQDGLTAEEIAEQYPSLPLSQVYAIIAYYLDHQVEVTSYLAAREGAAFQPRGDSCPAAGAPGATGLSMLRLLADENFNLLATCSAPDEWEGQVRYFPLR